MNIDPAQFRLLTFDCYGTLIDWERGLGEVLTAWAQRRGGQQSASHSAEELLTAFAGLEHGVQKQTPDARYPEILRQVLRGLGKELSLTVTQEDEDELALSVGAWPPFADSAAALAKLGQRYRLLVISNVDRSSFAASAAQLGSPFHGVVTAEDVGVYKPDPRMFERAFEVAAGWGIERSQILHVAQSLFHDVVPAQALGLSTVWVDRRRGLIGGATPPPQSEIYPDLVVGSMEEVAVLLGERDAG